MNANLICSANLYNASCSITVSKYISSPDRAMQRWFWGGAAFDDDAACLFVNFYTVHNRLLSPNNQPQRENIFHILQKSPLQPFFISLPISDTRSQHNSLAVQMPRDLEQERKKDKSPPITLTESPNRMASGSPISPTTEPRNFVIIPPDQQVQSGAPTNLHPYTRPLTISDLESCVALENAAFSDPNERASREKVRVSSPRLSWE